MQFDDSEEGADKKSFASTARDAASLMYEQKTPHHEESRSSSSQDAKWQEQWFSHEDRRMDKLDLQMSAEVMRCGDKNDAYARLHSRTLYRFTLSCFCGIGHCIAHLYDTTSVPLPVHISP